MKGVIYPEAKPFLVDLVSVGQHGVSLLSSCTYDPTMCDGS